MQLVSANDLFTEARQCLEGKTLKGEPHPVDIPRSESILNLLLSQAPGNKHVLYVLGALHLSKQNYGLAITLLSLVTNKDPGYGEAWSNLGLAYQGVDNWQKGAWCAAKAFKIIPNADIASNVAAMHLTRNSPGEALKFANMGLDIDPNHPQSRWHKGPALLEMQKWDEAWDYHEARLTGGTNERSGKPAHRNYHGPDGETPEWDGKSPGLIVIHGEQGLGDEIMFASCFADAMAVPGTRWIIEPSPRMGELYQRSFPGAKVYGTHKTDGSLWIGELGKPDYKIALGSLPKFFRRSAPSFPGTPYMVPDERKRALLGEKLRFLDHGRRRPNIGIAWQGGVESTRFAARSFPPETYLPMMGAVDANWISLQYDTTAQECVDRVRANHGVKIHHWPEAVEAIDKVTKKNRNIDDLVALISRLDLVVSVCQTAVHIAGALGVPCLCLTTSEPSWRYGVGGRGENEDMPWYGSVKLIRQERGMRDWAQAIEDATANVLAFNTCRERERAHYG